MPAPAQIYAAGSGQQKLGELSQSYDSPMTDTGVLFASTRTLFICYEYKFHFSVHVTGDARKIIVALGCVSHIVQLIQQSLDISVKCTYEFLDSFLIELNHAFI